MPAPCQAQGGMVAEARWGLGVHVHLCDSPVLDPYPGILHTPAPHQLKVARQPPTHPPTEPCQDPGTSWAPTHPVCLHLLYCLHLTLGLIAAAAGPCCLVCCRFCFRWFVTAAWLSLLQNLACCCYCCWCLALPPWLPVLPVAVPEAVEPSGPSAAAAAGTAASFGSTPPVPHIGSETRSSFSVWQDLCAAYGAHNSVVNVC